LLFGTGNSELGVFDDPFFSVVTEESLSRSLVMALSDADVTLLLAPFFPSMDLDGLVVCGLFFATTPSTLGNRRRRYQPFYHLESAVAAGLSPLPYSSRSP